MRRGSFQITLKTCFPGDRVVDKIRTSGQDSDVQALTSFDDELFVLLDQDVNQVAVYSMNDHRLLRYIHLPDLRRHHFNGVVACLSQKCLYLC